MKKWGKRPMSLLKWRCIVCGYIYDPEKGDPEAGIEPRTSFDSVPEEWTCPACGAPKEMFEELDE